MRPMRRKRVTESASELNRKYKGIWYGAFNTPITVKELLDKVIKQGRGFGIKHNRSTSDTYLVDEEGRSKFKLGKESVQYLIDNLPTNSWMRDELLKNSSITENMSRRRLREGFGIYTIDNLYAGAWENAIQSVAEIVKLGENYRELEELCRQLNIKFDDNGDIRR